MTAPDLWLCVNVGVDGVDIMAKEMSVVWLIVDFFSCYHRSDVSARYTPSIEDVKFDIPCLLYLVQFWESTSEAGGWDFASLC